MVLQQLQSRAKYIGNLLGFPENRESLTLLFGYFGQDNCKTELLARRMAAG